MEAYELLDFGDGARLERFGDHVTDRPHAGALAPRRDPSRWAQADLRYDRDRGWTAIDGEPRPWPCRIADLTLELRPTDAGQVGLFPEHALTLPWLTAQVRKRAPGRAADPADTSAPPEQPAPPEPPEPPEVLHLFAYTGLATLAMARAGAAVAHLDSSRPAVAWARANATTSGLGDRPVRWLVDDARDFVAREVRRGRRYDGIVMDPPSFGHGIKGTARWGIHDDLTALLAACRPILADDGFVLLTAHSEGLGPDGLHRALRYAWGRDAGGAENGELALPSGTGARLALSAYARWDRRA
ncbi:MAG: class I SAM-dependent rRNA methyltransferase [Candidatus Limnocylindrales bacterium]